MILNGWGRSKIINPKCTIYPHNNDEIINFFKKKNVKNIIPRGNGRSYGDSALGDRVISLDKYPKLINLNQRKGLVECSANILIKELNEYIINKGWFLNVTPGTKYVTIGGAVASDVHGKNHHIDGSFCDYIETLKIITPEGRTVECSKNKNKNLFRATCGGMGLTGLVISVNIKLLQIQSSKIDVTIFKLKTLGDLLKKFEVLSDNKYIISWVDHFSLKNNKLNSIVFSGNHSKNKILSHKEKKDFSLPAILGIFFLNNIFIRLFNLIYFNFLFYKKNFEQSFNDFFYPLDRIKNWNKFYGKNGFVQIQLLIKEKNAHKLLNKILNFFYEKKQISYLITLKKLGSKNNNLLSFPEKGFTITMDFIMSDKFKVIYKDFEKFIYKYNIKIYLTKDLLMTKNFFRKSYIMHNKFSVIKRKIDPKNKISSYQSKRIGI